MFRMDIKSQVADIMAGTMQVAGTQPTPAKSIATIWDAGPHLNAFQMLLEIDVR